MFLSVIGHSDHTDTLRATQTAIEQCLNQLGDVQPDAGIVFASTWYDYSVMLSEITAVFPKAQIVGCSSGGELSSNIGFRDDSICLILFASDTITIATGLGLNAAIDAEEAVRNAARMAKSELKGEPSLCLAFPDNLYSSPTRIIDTLHNELGHQCPIFGGFASAATFAADDVFQFYGSHVHKQSVSVILFSGPLKISFGISNSSAVVGNRTTIDSVEGNFVTRIGGQSALSYYRDTFGPHSEPLLEMPILVFEESGHSYLRVAVGFDEANESVRFYGQIPQGSNIQFTEETPEGIITNAEDNLKQLVKRLDSDWMPQLALVISCSSRKWILGTNVTEEAELIRRQLPNGTPFAGFYSYGEIAPLEKGFPPRYHNCTMIALLIGEQSSSKQSFSLSKPRQPVSMHYDLDQQIELLERKLSRTEYYMTRLERQKTLSGRMLRRLNKDLLKAKQKIENQNEILEKERKRLAEMTELLKKMFGRYLSPEVMNSLIENPSALELGGERRKVTIMMTDLRGFTALAERLQPEIVLQMLNDYFEVMVELILKYSGTINEFVGDALLVIFGAPQEMPDRVQRAIACAIEMQNSMARVNQENRHKGLPELEMGIGLNETDVIVGNIGSSKRSKYAVVGSGVNMTSRIESYTVGGQILISESMRQEAKDIIRIDSQKDVLPKGAETPIRIYEVGGIAGQHNMALVKEAPIFVALKRPVPIRYMILEGKAISGDGLKGSLVRLSKTQAEITLEVPVEILNNIKMNLKDVDENLLVKNFYGKVIKRSVNDNDHYIVHFTSISPEVDAYFQAIRKHAENPV